MSQNHQLARLHAVAEASHGVVRWTDAVHAGIPSSTLSRFEREGLIQRMHPGLYFVGQQPPSLLARIHAATLHTEGQACGLSAATLLGMRVGESNSVEVLVNRRHRGTVDRIANVRVVTTKFLLPHELARVKGTRCTNVTRTAIDLWGRMDEVEWQLMFDNELRRQRTSLDAIASRVEQLRALRKPGIARLGDRLASLSAATGRETPLEDLLADIIRSNGIPEPRYQFEVEVAGRRYRLDAAYPELGLAIEVDGRMVHDADDRFVADRQRQNSLVLADWTLLRFTWFDLTRRRARVAAEILSAIRRLSQQVS